MIDKELLKQMSALHSEKEDLDRRIQEIESEPRDTILDSVQGSSTSYPYISHTCKLEGVTYYPKQRKQKRKIEKLLKSNKRELDKKIVNLEYELKKVEDSEIRQIIRHVYEDGKDYNQTAHIMNQKKNNPKYTADSIRMQLTRFLKKF